jgi:hypothetical protein
MESLEYIMIPSVLLGCAIIAHYIASVYYEPSDMLASRILIAVFVENIL